jgi:hypothetical protein
MIVCDYPQGRYGNAIFRYFASSLFCILYNATREYNENACEEIITDEYFIDWSTQLLNTNILPIIDTSKKYLFKGYFQHDNIFLKYKTDLIKHIHNNPNDNLITDGYKPGGSGLYHYNVAIYKSIDLLIPTNNTNIVEKYDIVVHIRLEDFVFVNQLIHPSNIDVILEKYKDKQICFVLNCPKTEFEKKYISFFTNKYNIILESNDPITDYHIIKNAKILISSRSTLCWAASFFSDSLETVYFPNYTVPHRIHETFKQPIKNTIYYDIQLFNENEINYFLDNNV